MSTIRPTSVPTKRLASAITSAATTFQLTDIEGWDGANLASPSFGTKAYGVFRDATNSHIELFEFDPSTIALSSITILRRGLQFDGDLTTEVSGNKRSWTKGTLVELGTHVPQLFRSLVDIYEAQTIDGVKTFSVSPVVPVPTGSTEAASKGYVDGVAVAGAPNADTTTKGIVELATQAEILAKTATGGTGAALVVTPDKLPSTLTSDYKADTGAANAYVITPAPAITAYTVGQIFSFKATNANTTASTINVNGLGVKTIKKLDGANDLASGDIAAGQIVTVEYDGTNFQMLNPVANTPATVAYTDSNFIRFGGTGADGALAVSSGTTTIDLGNAAVVVKNYTSIAITGTGVLAFSNPNTNGTIVILKSTGNVTLTSSATPMLDLRNMGAQAAAGADGNNGAVTVLPYVCTKGAVGQIGQNGANAAGGTAPAGANSNSPSVVNTATAASGVYSIACGAAGGAGGAPQSGGGTSGIGGHGGGAILIECRGALNFTTASGISIAGQVGTAGTNGGGGGGGGAGGTALIVYNTLTSSSGTISVSGGTGGAGGTGAGAGGSGGAGGNGSSGSSTAGAGGQGGSASGAGGSGGGGGGSGGAQFFGTTNGTIGNAGANTGAVNQAGGGGGGGGASGFSLVVQNKNR